MSAARGKAVIDTATGITYRTIKDAAEATGIKHTTIMNRLKGRSSKGTIQYVDNKPTVGKRKARRIK